MGYLGHKFKIAGQADGLAEAILSNVTVRRKITGTINGVATTTGHVYLQNITHLLSGTINGVATVPRTVQLSGSVTITGDSDVPASEYS